MIIKNIKQRIAEHFYQHPTSKLRVREMERALKLPLPSVIKYCKELTKEHILTTTTIGTTTFYTANRTDETFLLHKKLYNIRSIYASGIITHLKETLHNPPIILYGSYARGEDTEESDIDLYIETSQKTPDLKAYEKTLKRTIQTITAPHITKIPKHLANNIMNGITLNNQVEAFR